MEKKIARTINLYPIFFGLNVDLLFYVAIDTLFLVTVKHFTEAQIVLLTTISTAAGVALRIPLLWLMKKIGNTATIRIGPVCLVLSATLITVFSNFWIICLGRCFRSLTIAINDSALSVALENNLDKMGKSADFIKYRAKGNAYYASFTIAIALVATYLFNVNAYLPMICCIVCTLLGMVMSFFIGDYTEDNKVQEVSKSTKIGFRVDKFILLALVAFGLLYSAYSNHIGDGKLFIQQDLLKQVSVETTATIVGGIYFLSRCVRWFSNVVYVRIYNRLRLKTGLFLAGLMVLAFASMLSGAFITALPIKIFAMGAGYVTVLFAGDPVRHYIQQIFVLYAPKEQHGALFATMGLVYQICGFMSSAIFTAVLLRFTMNSVMVIFLAIVAVGLGLMYLLYRQLVQRR